MEEKINNILQGGGSEYGAELKEISLSDPYGIAELINDKNGNNDPKFVSPILLAYIGDSVYDLIIRTALVLKGNRQVAKLNKDAVLLVSAKAQSKIADIILPMLNEEETGVYRRGVNSKPNTKSKNASFREYMKATGFEALVGYLYLSGKTGRITELVKTGIDGIKEPNTDGKE